MKKVTIRSKIVGREGSGTGIPSPSSPSAPVDLSLYLKKEVWDDAFELKETEDGVPYLFGKLPVLLHYGLTMYADPDNMGVPSLFDGIPIDNNTIYWDETTNADGSVTRVLKAKGVGGEGGSVTLLGDLENVGAWANALAEEDRIMVQKKGSSSWTSLLLSEIKGTADFSNVNESGEGNAYTSFTLSEDKKTLTFLKGETFAKSSDLTLKWTTDNDKIANWDTAFGWGDHSKQGYTTKTYVDGKFLPLAGGTITGDLRLRTGSEYTSPYLYFGDSDEVYLREATDRYLTIHADKGIVLDSPLTTIDGIEIKKSADGVLYIDANLVVSGGITMYGTDGTTSSSIWDGAPIASTNVKGIASFDSEFFAVNNGKVTFIGETGSGASSWDDLDGKPSWIGSTKPSYTFSEIGSKPTTLSGYGITDAKISNGVITLGSNTITPLTQTTGDVRYITAIGTSGNSLTYTKNGTTQNVTVPYATSASKLNTTSAYTAWGQTYWNNGVPTSVSGDMTGVGNISMTGSINSAVTINSGDDSSWIKGSGHKMYFGGTGYANQSYYFRPLYGASGATTSNLYIQNASASSSPTFTTTHSFLSNGNASHAGTLTINGIELSKSKDDVLFIDANLVVRGAVTMYGTNSVTASTVMDGVVVDGTTIMNDGKKLYLNPDLELGGLDEDELNSYLTSNKYITQTTGDARYITAIGVSGNYLTYTKNGATQNVTVPYATNADKLDGYHSTDFMRVNGSLTSNIDFDDYYTSGSYNNTTGNGSGNTNTPGTYGLMLVFGDKGGYAAQLHVSSGDLMKVRTRYSRGGSMTWSGWKELVVASDARTITPSVNNTYNLGSSSYKWNNVYATTFNGSLSGNATTATKATQDGDGNTISSTYLKLSGGTVGGTLNATDIASNRLGFSSKYTKQPSSVGWYRFAVGTTTNGTAGTYILSIRRVYNYVSSEAYLIAATLDYSGVSFVQLAGHHHSTSQLITKIRCTRTNSSSVYFDFYYNSTSANAVYVNAIGHATLQTPTLVTDTLTYTDEFVLEQGVKSNLGFVGNLTGTATKLETARTIWGQSFDGSGNITGHLYLVGANASSSTGNTSQILFGTTSSHHLALSSNTNSLIINPTSSTTTGQIVLGVNGNNTYFTSSGNFGIGTSSPSIKLHVNGDIGNEQILMRYSTTQPYLKLTHTYSGTSYNYYVMGNNGYIGIGATVSKSVKIDADGNVEITGNLLVKGGITMYGLSSAEEGIDGDLLPKETEKFNIGSEENRWNEVWTKDINMGGNINSSIHYGTARIGEVEKAFRYVYTNVVHVGTKQSGSLFLVGSAYEAANGVVIARNTTGTQTGEIARFNSYGLNLAGGLSVGTASAHTYITGGNYKLYVNGKAYVTSTLTQNSDIRYKEIHKDLSLPLATMAEAPSFEFHFTDDERKDAHIGTSAQYWKCVDGVVSEGADGRLGMDYSSLGVVMGVSLAKELSRFESDTDRRIRLLEEENKRLKEEIEQLKTI